MKRVFALFLHLMVLGGMAGAQGSHDAGSSWAIFLGTGHHEDNLPEAVEQLRRSINPFTDLPFGNTPVFVFGQPQPWLEGLRVFADHLDLPVLSSSNKLQAQHFDFVICHSNGCTKLFSAQRDGLVHADHILAFGADSTSRHFSPGELKGATVNFFVVKGDVIPMIPNLNWQRINENTPGLGFTIPFDNPKEVPRRAAGLNPLGASRTDPDRYPVVHLDVPRDAKRHTFATYLGAIAQWMKSGGKIQADPAAPPVPKDTLSLRSDELKKPRFTPPDDGGSGGGMRGGPSGHSSLTQGPPVKPTVAARGGVKAEIRIDERDFRRKP